MEVPVDGEATMWIYDGGKWLQQPGGKDGADGVDGLWTDNGDTTISYNDGNVGIGTNSPSGINGNADRRALHIHNPSGNVAGLKVTNAGNTTLRGVEITSSDDDGFVTLREAGSLRFWTDNQERMVIEDEGMVRIAGGQIRAGLYNTTEPGIGFRLANGEERFRIMMDPNNFGMYVWDRVLAETRMQLDNAGNLYARGNIYKNGLTPVIATSDMIKAFSKLRDAVKDEDTVESLKESITNCIGGLIEEWESMQSPATQEISDE